MFLKNISREGNISNFTWWLGEGVQGQLQEPTTKNAEISKENCTYIKLDPFQLILTSDCNQRRGSLCTHNEWSASNTKNTMVSSHATRSRPKRTVLSDMLSSVANIDRLLLAAEEELLRMERTPDEPTNQNRDDFIKYLLLGTVKLLDDKIEPATHTVTKIIKCSTGILLLSMNKCNIKTNPNPTSLFEEVFEIFRIISELVVSKYPQQFIIRHPTGIIYQSTHTPAELGNAVLGSEQDGVFIKLPSFAALKSQLGEYDSITYQMATFTKNPHPTDMVEIFLPYPNASIPTNTLRLSEGSPPTDTYFSNTTILSLTEGYRWMITPEMLQHTRGVWYIESGLLNSSWEPGLTLRINSFTAKCVYWDVKKETWSTYGCQVGDKSTPERTQCLCNHLTLFGSSFFVMPNYVDLSRTAELFSTLSDNFVVLALLCTFFGLYLVTLLWACYSDRRARSKRKMTLLEDNHPCAQYNYLIGVQTGHHPDKPVFERGAVDMFLLATPFPLGEVRNLRLQHDNSGGRPSWYINKVTVQDLQTRQVFHFFCNCWLSVDHGDNMTKKTFNAAKNNEVASFRNIFQTRTSTGFRDEHIWVSIVDPPSRSPFTRAQRVSCCMSLLLCTMAINIAFWNIPIKEDSPVVFEFGSMQITWQELMVGVQSGLLMFPINILIITIFRSIKPRVISKSHKGDSEESLRPPPVTIPSILKDTEEVISMMSISPRNKMSETHRLESTSDLRYALDTVHDFIQLMQGESESDPHWVYCSKFLLAGLCHLLMCLEKLDERNFPSPQDYLQTLNTTNILVRKAEMVFSSHLAYCPPPVKKRKKKATCWLPWWCVFLGWFLLLSISGISTFFTLLYGLDYGRAKSIKWVMSLGLSLFQSIFILQPLKVLGIAVFFALLLKPVAVEESEEIEQLKLEQQIKCGRYSGRHSL
ncbi:Polycystic kidney disease protein 1-like 2 [Dissostichus eleginoides]|uniref:Polycystic kidney disease protein 1-like 2 n=1 Tax=Dissostichus eleginoides TaxID=100907 RepID=A0AAD9BZL8_DISEL|nr:Polycystic kidney disease protein 1-like 2 [Dissostichus eleginoides]